MSMLVLASSLGIFVAVVLAAYLLVSYSDERVNARASLRTLDDYEVGAPPPRGAKNAANRSSQEVMKQLTAIGRRFTPYGYVDTVKEKLYLSGRQRSDEVDRYLARMTLSISLIPFWVAFYIFGPLQLKGILAILVFALPVVVLGLGPHIMLNRAVAERQTAIRRALPDTLDLLTISVEAGLGFEQAVHKVVGAVPGPLSEEFNRMLGELRAGSSRVEALTGIDERTGVPEVKSFVMAIKQADAFGISIARILRAQSEEMRIKRRQLAQEKAQKVPVKMLIPMVFCIFPSIFVVILGPAAISIMTSLAGT